MLQTERMDAVTLTPLSRSGAQDIVDGTRQETWAAGFPTLGDVMVAGRILEGTWLPVADDHPWGVWTISFEGTVIGGIGFHSAPDDDGRVEIGYGIAEEYRGQGITTAAVGMLLDIARDAGARVVFATTDPENRASQRVLEHCGFTHDGMADGELLWSVRLMPQSRP